MKRPPVVCTVYLSLRTNPSTSSEAWKCHVIRLIWLYLLTFSFAPHNVTDRLG